MNYSELLINNFKPTPECFNWCKDQFDTYANNIIIEGLAMPIIALITLFLSRLIYHYGTFIVDNTDLTEKNMEVIYETMNFFAILLLLGFFVWYLIMR